MLPGGWEYTEHPACNLPNDVATGFQEIFGTWFGAKYTPVLYCGTQVVHGKNHMIICDATLSDKNAAKRMAKVVLNQQPNPDKITGDWSIVSITDL